VELRKEEEEEEEEEVEVTTMFLNNIRNPNCS
jgi:hypothetical protein